jgi:hypothetical protein
VIATTKNSITAIVAMKEDSRREVTETEPVCPGTRALSGKACLLWFIVTQYQRDYPNLIHFPRDQRNENLSRKFSTIVPTILHNSDRHSDANHKWLLRANQLNKLSDSRVLHRLTAFCGTFAWGGGYILPVPVA